jgi:uncharacterized protein YyaL (SSP411 family)
MPNRLAREHSPYLLQHAENPVDWYPWGEEAFARARAEDRPIFLSIGYSTCHWCHVMERESFESREVADVLNAHYVAIKVDREERPDVDRLYMTFVQATTGSGGWPMSVWLTPELEPFFGGTYFPPKDAYGRPGFITVLEGVHKAWREDNAEVRKSGAEVMRRLREINADDPPGEAPGVPALQGAARVLTQLFDQRFAGFGSAPKFPRPVNLSFLLREGRRAGDAVLGDMVVRTLRAMGAGGMYDQLGGGFHRYSVDREWHVPHFEKMLYDQAQLVETLGEAYAGSRDAELARLARETVAYLERDLGDAATGAFFSAEDADSPVAPGSHERAEGAFYVWTQAEVERVAGADAGVIIQHYGVLPGGNADDPHGELTGKNVLHAREGGVAETAKAMGLAVTEVEAQLARGRAALLAVRGQRPRPHLDDKVLTGWNGLMIHGLVVAAGHLGEPAWDTLAARAAEGVLTAAWDGKTLHRRIRKGHVGLPAQLDDFAALARACLALYQATFEPRWLERGHALVTIMHERFWDEAAGGWYATPGDDPSLRLRLKEDYDGAEPSGTSLAMLACFELAELTGDDRHAQRAHEQLALLAGRLRQQPHAMPLGLVAVDWALGGASHVVIAGAKDDPRTRALHRVARAAFVPRRVILSASDAGAGLPWAHAMTAVDGAPAAYVCRNRACERPVTTPEALASALGVGV